MNDDEYFPLKGTRLETIKSLAKITIFFKKDLCILRHTTIQIQSEMKKEKVRKWKKVFSEDPEKLQINHIKNRYRGWYPGDFFQVLLKTFFVFDTFAMRTLLICTRFFLRVTKSINHYIKRTTHLDNSTVWNLVPVKLGDMDLHKSRGNQYAKKLIQTSLPIRLQSQK